MLNLPRLQLDEHECCNDIGNLTPILMTFIQNGSYQIDVTTFCKKCGWLSTNSVMNNKTFKDGEIIKQKTFNLLTSKIDYICFPDKNPDIQLAKLLNKEVVFFKQQRIRKNDKIPSEPNN